MNSILLHLGAGNRKIPGFINIDIEPGADLQLDLTQPLPWEDRSVSGIFSEHFIEHVTQAEAIRLLHECRRVLVTGGVIRIATPDLHEMIGDYAENRTHPDLERFGLTWTANRCERFNMAMRWWGHQWVYDEEELTRLARMVGLELRGRYRIGESDLPAFRNLEHREGSSLILEFRKPDRMLATDAMPLVSIVMPTYRSRFFEAALQSAINQTYANTEIVICDDCPDDGIAEIAEKHAGRDHRIRYLRNGVRLHLLNLIECFDQSRGEFIKFLNDDDLLAPDCIERMLECYRTLPDITLVTSKRTLIDEHGLNLPDAFVTQSPVPEDAIVEGITLGTALLATGNNFVGEPSTTIFRKSDAAHLKPDYISVDNQQISAVNDIAVWINLATQGNVVYLTRPLSQFRIHPNQTQVELRDEVVAGATKGFKIMRSSWERRGFTKGQFFGTINWKPTRTPDAPWLIRTVCEDFTGWKDAASHPNNDEKPAQTTPTPVEQSTISYTGTPLNGNYNRWMDTKALDEQNAQIFQEHASKLWKKRILFEFILVLEPGSEAFLADSIDSIAQQYYDGWRLTILAQRPSPDEEFTREGSNVQWMQLPDGANIAEVANKRLTQTPAGWIGLFACGTRFAPQFLLILADYIAIHPEWRLVYSDEDAVDAEQRRDPQFKPDFNLELLCSTDYIGGVFVEKNALQSAGAYSRIRGAETYDTILRIADASGETGIGHIADVLSHISPACPGRAAEDGAVQALREHFARRNIDAEIEQGNLEGITRRVIYRHPETPKVSIIIPTRNRLELLGPCVESLLKNTRYPDWELLIVDNGSDDANVTAYYETLCSALPDKVRLLHYDAPFNYSAMNNLAARSARGDYLLLLNNDTECIHDDWLDAMMCHAQRPDAGIVGARLLFPDSLKVQHAGIILGMTGTAGHVSVGSLSHDEPGYLNRAQVDQEYSAVTGACLLVRKTLFEELGGLDENDFRVSFNDIDLCLKVRQKGYRVIWTPFATLLHHGSATQLDSIDPQKRSVFQQECNRFYLRWEEKISNDQAWNRNLSIGNTAPTIEDDVFAPWNGDFHDRPRILVMPPASQGIAEYRSLAPLRALHAEGRVQYAPVCQPHKNYERTPMPAELHRLAPDTLVIDMPVDNLRCQALLSYPRFNSPIFRVYTLDDLITHLPTGNPSYETLPADAMAERLTLGLKACHRLVVSTEPLADAYRHLIDDIRIVPNSLPWPLWGHLQPQHRRGKKMRVGWAGAQQHAGDLQLVLEVVKATHREVDWIFFGMLLNDMSPYVAEFHDYVHDFFDYPAKLASLDLDLAIAPLEIHPFNEAKSNLRLLEYGILGWPVVCTDIFPYRTDNPPVTRLPNDPAKWIAAIREKIAEPDALAREGDALREWVKRHYLLENRLDQWFSAFTS